MLPTDRQLIMGSPANNGSAGASTTFTITASEPGTVHLDTLVLQCGFIEAANTPSPDITPFGSVSSILIDNAIELIRGRGAARSPAGALSGYRGVNALRLGDWHVQAGNTIALTFDDDTLLGNAYAGSMAAAFTPRQTRGGVAEPAGQSTYVGSLTATPGADGQDSAVLTFDEDGVFSLGSIQSRVQLGLRADSGGGPGAWIDGSPICDITGITLPSGNAVIIGQNTPVCPATFLAAGLRAYSFSNLGAIAVSAGDTITIAYDNNDTDVASQVSFGGRFYPGSPVRSAVCR